MVQAVCDETQKSETINAMQKTRVAPNVAGLSIRLMSDGQVKSDYSELPAIATLTEEFAPILHFLTVKDLLVHIF